jgi:acetolactate synthase small subunit
LGATKEELEYGAVREALFWLPTGYFKWSKDLVDRITVMNNTRLLIVENQELEARISQLEVQFREVQLLRTPFDLTTPVDISMDDGEASLAQTNEDGEASNLYR